MKSEIDTSPKPSTVDVGSLARGSASGKHTPGPWHWQYSPMTNLPIALANEKRDVLLSTGDDESAWAEVNDADMKLIARAPDLLAAVEDLMQIVEGFRGERWAANGRRLVDTPEWCRLYTLRSALLRSEPNAKGDT